VVEYCCTMFGICVVTLTRLGCHIMVNNVSYIRETTAPGARDKTRVRIPGLRHVSYNPKWFKTRDIQPKMV